MVTLAGGRQVTGIAINLDCDSNKRMWQEVIISVELRGGGLMVEETQFDCGLVP